VVSHVEGAISVRIVVDYSKCSGIGICESIAPKYYEVNDDGELVLLQEDVADADVEAIAKTVAECPSGALSLRTE
jgi:ferredoxin